VGFRCVRSLIVATPRLGISSGTGTLFACSATSEPSEEPFLGRFPLRLTFAPGSHLRQARVPPSHFPLPLRQVAPESAATVPFILSARGIGKSAPGFPNGERPSQGDDLLGFAPVHVPEPEARLEPCPGAVVCARASKWDGQNRWVRVPRHGRTLQGRLHLPEHLRLETEPLAQPTHVKTAGFT